MLKLKCWCHINNKYFKKLFFFLLFLISQCVYVFRFTSITFCFYLLYLLITKSKKKEKKIPKTFFLITKMLEQLYCSPLQLLFCFLLLLLLLLYSIRVGWKRKQTNKNNWNILKICPNYNEKLWNISCYIWNTKQTNRIHMRLF